MIFLGRDKVGGGGIKGEGATTSINVLMPVGWAEWNGRAVGVL